MFLKCADFVAKGEPIAHSRGPITHTGQQRVLHTRHHRSQEQRTPAQRHRTGLSCTAASLLQSINRARRKAAERGVTATFLVMDALVLEDLPDVVENVIDSRLFHVFSDEDRKRYVQGLATVLKVGGRMFMLCFSDDEPGMQGPRRVSWKAIEVAFAEG
jgi:hypothetical protein